jgi:toxic protein SymE
MATLESTTQQSTDAKLVSLSSAVPEQKFDSRRLTVSGGAMSGGEGSAPCIRLLGRWLEQAGFAIGSKVDVSVTSGRLVIDTVPVAVEQKPRLPRRAASPQRERQN